MDTTPIFHVDVPIPSQFDRLVDAESDETLQWLRQDVQELVSKGKSDEEIVSSMVKTGWPEDFSQWYIGVVRKYGSKFVLVTQETLRAEWRERLDEANAVIAKGAGFAIIGGLISAITYAAAEGKGGTYVVFYGPVIYGVITFFKGLKMRVTCKK